MQLTSSTVKFTVSGFCYHGGGIRVACHREGHTKITALSRCVLYIMSSTSSFLYTLSSWYDAYFITANEHARGVTWWYTSAPFAYTDLSRAPIWCSFMGVSCGINQSLRDYRRVISISLPACKLEGSLTSLGSLSEMLTFDISDNKVSGSISPSICFYERIYWQDRYPQSRQPTDD